MIRSVPYLRNSLLCSLLFVFGAFTGQGQVLNPSLHLLTNCELSVTLVSTQHFCSGAEACIQIEGGVAPYIITFPGTSNTNDNSTTTSGLSICFEDLPPGQYPVLVTDAEGCSGGLTISIPVVDYLLDAQVTPVSCYGGGNGAIDLNIYIDLAPLYFSWEGPDGFTADTEDIAGLIAGYYSVSVTTTDEVCVGVGSWEVKEPDPIQIEVAVTTSACGQVDACVFVTGGTAPYHIWAFNTLPPQLSAGPYGSIQDWTGLDPASGIPYDPTSNTGPAFCAQNVQPGTYYVLAVDAHLCYAWKKVEIENGGGLHRENLIYPANCAGEPSGAVCYKVQGGTPPYTTYLNPAVTPNDTGLIGETGCFEGLAAGMYKLITIDANGCSAAEIIQIKEPQPLKAEFKITSLPCTDEVDGCLYVRGGTQPFRIFAWRWNSPLTVIPNVEFDDQGEPYVEGGDPADLGWSDGNPSTDVLTWVRCAQDIPAGYYIILVLDDHHCYTLLRVLIPESTGLEMETGKRDVSCNGAQDGAIKLTVKGGTPPYTLVSGPEGWEQVDDHSFVFRNLGPGEYVLTVTDSEGCSGTVAVIITAPDPIVTNLDFDPYGEYACVEITGGTEPYHIRWFDLGSATVIGTGKCIYDLPEGAYLLQVSDAKGCVAEDILFIAPLPCSGGEAYVEPSVIHSGETTYFILVNHVGSVIQWQFKTEFTGWINIPGANEEVYETPPLYSGTDKKIRVRAVVLCQGEKYVSTETELLIKGSNLLPPALDDQAADRFLFDPERRLAALAPQMLQAEEGALKVFPNPARDHVQILLPSAIQENGRISVYNAAGQLVRSLELEGPGSTSAALDLTGLERGVYFIRLQSPGYSGVTRLVVGQ